MEGSEDRPKQEDKNNLHDLTVNIPDLVGHGDSQDFIIVHDHHLVHAEHLSRFHVSQKLAMLAALECDGLTPLICSGFSRAIGQAHQVVAGGGRGDHWKVRKKCLLDLLK